MASARKRGNGYEIKVYCGLRPDTLGRIDKYEMWYPEPGMTPKQIEKALENAGFSKIEVDQNKKDWLCLVCKKDN